MSAWFSVLPPKRAFSYAVSQEIKAFLEIEAAKRGYTLAQLRARDRTTRITVVRQAIMVAAYATGRWSFITVGKALNRDHSTVKHAWDKAEAQRALREAEAA